MFVSAPETAAWIQFPEARMALKYLFCTMGFEHDFRILDGIPLRNVDLKMDMNSSKTKLAELESKWFEFTKPFGAGVDVRLFPETIVSILGVEFHGYPVVSCVMRWLFIASATYIFHIMNFSCRTFIGQAYCLSRATKKRYVLTGKKRCGFPSAGLSPNGFRPRSIPSRN